MEPMSTYATGRESEAVGKLLLETGINLQVKENIGLGAIVAGKGK
jgi:hypothetical protein